MTKWWMILSKFVSKFGQYKVVKRVKETIKTVVSDIFIKNL